MKLKEIGYSPKVGEALIDNQVAVCMQKENIHLAISGSAQIIEDQRKLDELWNSDTEMWFPQVIRTQIAR
jgi:general stress protein 26